VRPGFVLFRVDGKGATGAFQHEAGGHRIQRVPPTEKRGRVHTSTITVAVLGLPKEHEIKIDPRDLEEKFTRGSGPGGQHRNKTDTAVVLTHRPSGLTVRVENGKSQALNRQTAMEVLRARLKEEQCSKAAHDRNAKRKAMCGTGMRADKRRTVAHQRGTVVDHVTGKSMSVRKYLRGHIKDLH
jgi:peptide chain release factor 1